MRPLPKLGLFGLLLVSVLGGGAVAGAAFGPIDTGTDAEPSHDTHETRPRPEEAAVTETTEAALPAGGLLVSEDGYTFSPDERVLDGGDFTFTIVGPDGTPVTEYQELHDRRLHLIVASRDLREYAHVHPTLGTDGTWTVALPTFPPGAYRAFADFHPVGAAQHTLGVDLTVPGPADPAPPLEADTHDEVGGFAVELASDPGAGSATVTVRRGGQVVTTEPYLGAAGHLVALRDGDLAYLHVHPMDEVPAGPVRFAVEYPSGGLHALFFDFQVDGQVHTARFVVDAQPPVAGDGHADDGHGH